MASECFSSVVMAFLGIIFLNWASVFSLDWVKMPFVPVLSLGVAAFYYYKNGYFSIFILFIGYVASFFLMRGVGPYSIDSGWFFVLLLSVIYSLQSVFWVWSFENFPVGCRLVFLLGMRFI
jgi:hypothetical protein